MISVLDHGYVELEDSMASDLSVVNAARVSFNNHHLKMEEGDDKLIRFLMKNKHGTPFEHNAFRFRIKAPLFVFREWQRHRWSSFNEWSGRYSELKPEFYIPVPKNVRTQTGKPGAYTFEPTRADVAEAFIWRLEKQSNLAFGEYEDAINGGIAKELARLFLPLNIYSEMFWTVNARALMNFLSLRNADTAMFEIREYAEAIEEYFDNEMPVTAQAFVANGRIAP